MSEKLKQGFWDRAAFAFILVGGLPFFLMFGALVGGIVLVAIHCAFASDGPAAFLMRWCTIFGSLAGFCMWMSRPGKRKGR